MNIILIALLLWIAPAILLGLVIGWVCYLRPGARKNVAAAAADESMPQPQPQGHAMPAMEHAA